MSRLEVIKVFMYMANDKRLTLMSSQIGVKPYWVKELS